MCIISDQFSDVTENNHQQFTLLNHNSIYIYLIFAKTYKSKNINDIKILLNLDFI